MPQRRRILLVEDDADTSAALYQLFRHAGYSVLAADDGQQALDLLERGIRPRLIIVDIRLPNVSGSELLQYIETDIDLRAIPRVVVSAVPPDSVQVVADYYFQKPVDPDLLLRTVMRLAPVGDGGADRA